jgi:hypothetical protein
MAFALMSQSRQREWPVRLPPIPRDTPERFSLFRMHTRFLDFNIAVGERMGAFTLCMDE